MSIYENDPLARPDDEFEPGRLHHLVIGNRGRLLDPRRTPITLVALHDPTGQFVVRVDAFEDKGALWEIPYEDVDRFQFTRPCARLGDVAAVQRIIGRFDQPMHIPAKPEVRATTDCELVEEADRAGRWLTENSTFFRGEGSMPDPSERAGDVRLRHDLHRYLIERDLWQIEESLAARYVTNPRSGELIKGHRIVLAELGLVPYEGKVVRDPALLEGDHSRPIRVAHILARMGFVRAVFARWNVTKVTLFRGLRDEPAPRNDTFVSATFDRDVAVENAAGAYVLEQRVSVERIFMTYHETEAMNQRFREAEAILLYDPDAPF